MFSRSEFSRHPIFRLTALRSLRGTATKYPTQDTLSSIHDVDIAVFFYEEGMSLRLGFGKLLNVGIHILPSIASKESKFCLIPQSILSAQIARNYSDRFSIAPKKKKIRSV